MTEKPFTSPFSNIKHSDAIAVRSSSGASTQPIIRGVLDRLNELSTTPVMYIITNQENASYYADHWPRADITATTDLQVVIDKWKEIKESQMRLVDHVISKAHSELNLDIHAVVNCDQDVYFDFSAYLRSRSFQYGDPRAIVVVDIPSVVIPNNLLRNLMYNGFCHCITSIVTTSQSVPRFWCDAIFWLHPDDPSQIMSDYPGDVL